MANANKGLQLFVKTTGLGGELLTPFFLVGQSLYQGRQLEVIVAIKPTWSINDRGVSSNKLVCRRQHDQAMVLFEAIKLIQKERSVLVRNKSIKIFRNNAEFVALFSPRTNHFRILKWLM